ncbi:hypothetical protein [Streptomyces sp. NPDC005805]|uniref:Tc toxin subunit A-related protein n=1 Tax=Streptomyces sp. NPDC005805 TaxID=3157068 RepID=UPI0033EE9806
MAAHPIELYSIKVLRPDAREGPAPSGSLEKQIQAHILDGNRAYFRQRYESARSHYLAAWELLPKLILPTFPQGMAEYAPDRLLDLDLVPALLEASVQIHRLRPSLGPTAHIVPPLDPPAELVELTDHYAGSAGKVLRMQETSASLLRQGELQPARRYAEELLALANDEQRAAGTVLTAAIALAEGDIDGAREGFSYASEIYQDLDQPEAQAATRHNLGVVSSLAGEPAEAARYFASAVNRLPAMDTMSVTQALNPGSAEVTRPVGAAGLPLLMKSGVAWDHLATGGVSPLDHLTVTTRDGAITLALAAGAAELEDALFRPRIDATAVEALTVDLARLDVFTTYLGHVRGFVLPLALGDTYHALGRFDLAAKYFVSAGRYRYLNLAIELPILWAKLARTFLAEGDRFYRQQNTAAAKAAYERIVKIVPGGFEVSGPLYEGAFAPLAEETRTFLDNPDPIHFDGLDLRRTTLLLQAIANLRQIDDGINYLGIPDEFVPIHPWRYLQNQARYFANQAIQAERAYLNFKATAEKDAFTRLTLEQAVGAQKSAVKVEEKKVSLAQAQQEVAQASAELARQRVAQAHDAQADYAAVSEQSAFYDEISAAFSAPAGSVHIGPDYAQQLGIQLTHVRETYTGLLGSSTFEYVKNVEKADILRTMNRSRSKVTRDLELRNMDRKIEQLESEKGIADGQVRVARKGVQAAEAQRRLAELRARQAVAQLDAFRDQELTPELWDDLAETQREISRRYLDWAIGAAFLMERAYEFEYDTSVNRIRFDYGRSELDGLLAADLLLADIDQFSYDRLLDTGKKAPVKVSIALADRYPFQFRRFQDTGRIDFQTSLDDFDRWNPGTYRRKLRRVEVVIEGIVGADGLHGTLTSSGISLDRNRDGTVQTRVQRPETMILSRFDLRGDGFVFAATDEEVLAAFENCGVAGGWTLDLPLDVNDVNFRTVTNVHLVLYYDAYYSDRVASTVKAELAAVARDERMIGLALRFQYPDEFFNFQSTGRLTFDLDEASLPFHHTAPEVRDLQLALETVEGVSPAGITVTAEAGGVSVSATTDAHGLVGTGSAALAPLRGRPLTGSWTLRIDPELNGPAFAAGFGWDKVQNLAYFADYTYTPRGRSAAGSDFTTDPPAGFDAVDDPGAVHGPGVWNWDAGRGVVRQQGTVYDPALQNTGPAKPGTLLLGKPDTWPVRRNLVLRTRLASDGNGIGVVLRYLDPDNYYYFLMDADLGYRRIGRKVAGVFAELGTPAVDRTTGHTPGRTCELAFAAVDDTLVVALDGVPVLSGTDGSIASAGRFGFLAWKNPTALFHDLRVRDV